MRAPVLVCLVSLSVLVSPLRCRGEDDDNVDPLLRAEVELLIEQLGHDEFAQREAATERLLEIGLPAMPMLERGQTHLDREIRYRCVRILTRMRAERRRRRLEAFLSYNDSAYEEPLPGWTHYVRLTGDHPESRALFAKMVESEWELLARFEHDPDDASEAFYQRCVGLEQAKNQLRLSPTLPTVATLLLLAGDPSVTVTDQTGTKLYILCNQVSAFQQSLEIEGPDSAAIRGLVGQWIRRVEGSLSSYYCLILAMRYNVPEGVILARRVLAQTQGPIHHREYAILTIAKVGDTRDVPLLEGLLDDRSICKSRTDSKTKIKTYTQIRDVALASIIHLSGEDPKKFGFTQLQTNPLYVFVTLSAGFVSEEQRSLTHRMWHEFSHRQRPNEPNVRDLIAPDPPIEGPDPTVPSLSDLDS